MKRILVIRKISFDILPNMRIIVGIDIDLHEFDSAGVLINIESGYGQITQPVDKLPQLIPIKDIAVNGSVDTVELMSLINAAAIMLVAEHYSAPVIDGQVVLGSN